MLKIYHAPRTRSIRVIWLCEELDIPYEVVPTDFGVAYRATPEWRAMNPVGKLPVMVDGDLKLFESGAMMQWLLDRYGEGRLTPVRGSADYATYLQWLWFGEATFARPLGEIVNHRREFSEAQQSEEAIKEMQNRAWLCVEALDQALSGQDYLVGDFTACDIMNGYSLMLTEWLVPKTFPRNVAKYWQRLNEHPGFTIAQNTKGA